MDASQLVDVLTPEPIGQDRHDRFRGSSPTDRDRQIYGGQYLAQALLASAATVDPDRSPHSLHAVFLRPGSPGRPIEYRVDRIRDGRTASHRSVMAIQDDVEIFRQHVSFQIDRAGPSYPPPEPPGSDLDPSSLMPYREWVRDLSDQPDHDWFTENRPIDLRIEHPPSTMPRSPIEQPIDVWMRLVVDPADDPNTGLVDLTGASPVVHAALLAWMSDKTIADVTLYPHGRSWTDQGADLLSLDHAMWFFEPVRADRWHRLRHEVPATRRGRGLARGEFTTTDGVVVASVAQEAFLIVPD